MRIPNLENFEVFNGVMNRGFQVSGFEIEICDLEFDF